ncbi:hypothetical protein CHLNCDRAFT_51213 [Chlorella variabilis]|uniref:Uncharacterized protein n=1 Tax=Chlorella variabilis TaxID=554065 RepID=E1ZB11_CHLVA|nr:hypothetical protein CHLNCDRAFT_51213 [Chlorella variabilis]EFN56945.1 hypothetical protein CHLNCDRAFT_51213 [Chlorella variabilis]|eukprot:XP_005849047.1 hypothetical protein CHLNCDRAFT_51213 [Chlorella variabilis]
MAMPGGTESQQLPLLLTPTAWRRPVSASSVLHFECGGIYRSFVRLPSAAMVRTRRTRASQAPGEELAGVHPRDGILYLTPFRALERISMCGTSSETCKLTILEGLPCLKEVVACGYGEYVTEGLPASVQRLDLQWAVNAASSSLVYFHVPERCTLAELALCSQRPVCLPAPCLARCASLRVTARRAYLGLPLLAGAPWVDVDELAARFAQFMLCSSLEAVEVTATRCFVFQPVQDPFDLSTNEGLGGISQQEQLATVLLARHFQSLHVEQRMLAVGAFRAYMRITRRRTEPIAFSFQAQLNAEQASPREAHSALQSIHGTWHSEPLAPLGPAALTSLRLTPPLGAQPPQRAFRSRWLAGLRRLAHLTLVRFTAADLRHLRAGPSAVHLSSMQPPGGAITPHTLRLPPGGLGPECSLSLRMAYAPPHAIVAPPQHIVDLAAGMPVADLDNPAGGGGAWPQFEGHGGGVQQLGPGALAVALQQQAAALAAMAQQAAAVAAPAAAAAAAAAAQPAAAAAHGEQAVQQAAQQVVAQAAEAEAVAAEAEAFAAEAAAAAAQAGMQQQDAGVQAGAAAAAAVEVEVIDLVSDSDDEELPEDGAPLAPQPAEQLAAAAPAAAPQAPAPAPAAAAHPPAAAAAAVQAPPQLPQLPAEQLGQEGMADLLDSDEDDGPMPELIDDDELGEDDAFAPPPQASAAPQGRAGAGAGTRVSCGAQRRLAGWLAGWHAARPKFLCVCPAWGHACMRYLGGHLFGPGGGPLLGGWVMVPAPAQQAAQEPAGGAQQAAQMAAGGIDFAQPWAMPDDRLADATIRHEALLTGVGSLAVHAGSLTVVYPGTTPDHLLRLLSGGGGGGGGGSVLRSLRLSARALRFEAAPAAPAQGSPGGGGGGGEVPGGAAASAPPTQQPHRGFSGPELREYIQSSGWAAVWDARLQRSMFRDQETLVLTRRPPPPAKEEREGSPAAAGGGAAAAPATL